MGHSSLVDCSDGQVTSGITTNCGQDANQVSHERLGDVGIPEVRRAKPRDTARQRPTPPAAAQPPPAREAALLASRFCAKARVVTGAALCAS